MVGHDNYELIPWDTGKIQNYLNQTQKKAVEVKICLD